MMLYLKVVTTAPFPLGHIVEIYCIATLRELGEDWYSPNWHPPNDVYFISFSDVIERQMTTLEQRAYKNSVIDHIIKEKGFGKVDYSKDWLFDWIFKEYGRIDESLFEFVVGIVGEEEKPDLFIDANSLQYLEKYLKKAFFRLN